jgi:hypothetical protein
VPLPVLVEAVAIEAGGVLSEEEPDPSTGLIFDL